MLKYELDVWTLCVQYGIFLLSIRREQPMPLSYKDDRIHVRVKKSEKEFLNYAAEQRKVDLSVFVRDSALKEAEEVMAEKVHFSLPDKQWKAFCAALDKPAREIPKLKKLFAKPSIFDERKAAS